MAILTAVVLAGPIAGQQPPAAGRGTATAPPPINWPSPPIPDGPLQFETGLVRPITITALKGLNQPWSMAFLPDGAILIAERPGRLRLVRAGVLDPTPVAGLPPVQAQGLAGLMDLALHPRFADNRLVYLHVPQAADAGPRRRGPGAAGRGRPRACASARHDHPRARTMGRRQAGRRQGHLQRGPGRQRLAHRLRT